MRTVILHYHLFKNAGTSVDYILQASFGGAWTTREFLAHGDGTARHVADWIQSEPTKAAFSSHTANGPLPTISETRIIPILFIRHPLDRLRSAYLFERTQAASTYGNIIARETSMGGYMRIRLSTPGERFASNFHAAKLRAFSDLTSADEEQRALDGLAKLGFVGVVDEFEASMQRFESLIQPYLSNFRASSAHENASSDSSLQLADRLSLMQKEIGQETWDQLCEANAIDLAIYAAARRRLV